MLADLYNAQLVDRFVGNPGDRTKRFSADGCSALGRSHPAIEPESLTGIATWTVEKQIAESGDTVILSDNRRIATKWCDWLLILLGAKRSQCRSRPAQIREKNRG